MYIFAAKAAVKAASPDPGLSKHIDSLLSAFMKWMNLPPNYTPFVEWGVRVSCAVFIFFLFMVLARRAQLERIVGWVDDKIGAIQLTPSDRNFIAFVAWLVLWLPGLLLILFMLKLTALLATVGLSAGVLTAIVAASNRTLLSNVSAGLVLQARRHINRNDFIKVMNLSGTLTEIGLTSCILEDADGVRHFIPNSKLLDEVLTNYSVAEFRRQEVVLWLEREGLNFEEVDRVMNEMIAGAEGLKLGKEGFYRYGACSEKGLEVKLYLYFDKSNWGENASKARQMLVEKVFASGLRFGVPQQAFLVANEQGQASPLPVTDGK